MKAKLKTTSGEKLYYYETKENWYIQLSLICHDG